MVYFFKGQDTQFLFIFFWFPTEKSGVSTLSGAEKQEAEWSVMCVSLFLSLFFLLLSLYCSYGVCARVNRVCRTQSIARKIEQNEEENIFIFFFFQITNLYTKQQDEKKRKREEKQTTKHRMTALKMYGHKNVNTLPDWFCM